MSKSRAALTVVVTALLLPLSVAAYPAPAEDRDPQPAFTEGKAPRLWEERCRRQPRKHVVHTYDIIEYRHRLRCGYFTRGDEGGFGYRHIKGRRGFIQRTNLDIWETLAFPDCLNPPNPIPGYRGTLVYFRERETPGWWHRVVVARRWVPAWHGLKGIITAYWSQGVPPACADSP